MMAITTVKEAMGIEIPSVPDITFFVIDEESVTVNVNIKGGIENVKQHHEHIFNSTEGSKTKNCEECIGVLSSEILHLEKDRKNIRKKKETTDKKLPKYDEAINPPWSLYNKVLFTILGIFSIFLISLGGVTVYTNIMATQRPFFLDNQWAVVLFTSIFTIAFPWGVKLVSRLIETDGDKRRYTLGVILFSLFCGAVWAILFASLYGGVAESLEDILSGVVNDTENSSGDGVLGTIFIISQLFGEAFAAAGFWMIMDLIYHSHYQYPKIDNPDYIFLCEQEKTLSKKIDAYLEKKLAFSACRKSLESVKNVFIEKAVNRIKKYENRVNVLNEVRDGIETLHVVK